MPIDMDGSTEILERRRWAKDLPATGTERHRVVVTGSLVKLKGNADPYFLLTCEVVNLRARKGGPNWEVSGGADHALILEHWPELAPLADMHLGAPDGTPMHAAPNAIYWAGFSRWNDGRQMSPADEYGRIPVEVDAWHREWSPAMLARHLNVTEDEAREIRARVAPLPVDRQGAAMGDEVSSLAARWADKADQALRLLQQEDEIEQHKPRGGAWLGQN